MKFSHNGRRLSGLAVPLSAIRTDVSPGCGEFPDLVRAGDLAASWGIELIQLLPVNDSGYQNSPYSALSAFALHPIYLRIGDIPELAQKDRGKAGDRAQDLQEFSAEAATLIHRFSGEEQVPHEALLKAKVGLLRKIWAVASKGTGPDTSTLNEGLAAWIAANPWSRSYAAFVALKSLNENRPWWEWARNRDPNAADIDSLWGDRALVSELHFWAWVQMRAAEQFQKAALSLAENGIALMGDIPILMNADSADVWARRNCFQLELSAGAPPDMYSGLGQNWGFPIYDWDTLEREGFGFWIDRLAEADKYYSCYRIDHVLGFFRIWSLSERENTGALGHFVPDIPMTRFELESLGFSAERIRWLSKPHVPGQRLIQAAGESAAQGAVASALERIGEEDLFLFRDSIKGEKDIEALPSISPAARDCLLEAWRDRAIFEYEPDNFVRTCNHRSATSWGTLSDHEREKFDAVFGNKRVEAEALWASTGKRLLGVLASAVPMLPCAEDLGSVPDCVPKVLKELGILGLRVFRWTRLWNEGGQPYIPLTDYPELSVACPSVHDSSSIREWWETEADREGTWGFVVSSLGVDAGPCPKSLDTDQVALILELMARSASRFAVYPLQDILAMSDKLRPVDPRSERINVPGTVGAGNWAYRVPSSIDAILGEKKLAGKVHALVKARSSPRKKAHGKSQDPA